MDIIPKVVFDNKMFVLYITELDRSNLAVTQWRSNHRAIAAIEEAILVCVRKRLNKIIARAIDVAKTAKNFPVTVISAGAAAAAAWEVMSFNETDCLFTYFEYLALFVSSRLCYYYY